VLHLLTAPAPELVLTLVRRQVEAGDRVHVVLLQGTPAPPLPGGAALHRVPDDRSWDHLLDLLFTAEHVFTW
jgi:hypothetical protein